MPHFELSPVETRVLGCLLEKERVTPENYPLSLHGLTAACNQATNRDPVTGFDERTVEGGVTALREKKLATLIHSAGARVGKYRHDLPNHYELQAPETALLCVLLLRGPQTPGELRARTERLHPFRGVEEVEACLVGLAGGDDPLVRVLPARPGQKERRFVQLLSGEPAVTDAVEAEGIVTRGPSAPAGPTRIDGLESDVAALREEVRQLREELAAFRRQFE